MKNHYHYRIFYKYYKKDIKNFVGIDNLTIFSPARIRSIKTLKFIVQIETSKLDRHNVQFSHYERVPCTCPPKAEKIVNELAQWKDEVVTQETLDALLTDSVTLELPIK